MYKWQQVKTLKAQGVSIKEMTKRLKLSKRKMQGQVYTFDIPVY